MIVPFAEYSSAHGVDLHTPQQLFTPVSAVIGIWADELPTSSDPDTREYIRVDFDVALEPKEMPIVISPLYLFPAAKDPHIRRAACRSVAALAAGCGMNITEAEFDDEDPVGSMYDILKPLEGRMITIQCRTDDDAAKKWFLIEKWSR